MFNNNSVKKVHSVIDGLDRDGNKQVFPDNPNIPPFRPTSIPKEEGEALSKWVKIEKAERTIEIGLAYGFSALHIGEGLLLGNATNPKHTVIDAYQAQEDKYAKVGLNILTEAGLGEIIEFYGEKSEIVLPRLLSENRNFDFAFVDGCHLFDCVFLDLFYLGRIVKKGGIIFLDDYDKPAIRKSATFFIKNLEWKIEEIEKDTKSNREWAVMRTSENEDTRQWNSFIDF
jgi:predicted O-methyltransferase YrrM